MYHKMVCVCGHKSHRPQGGGCLVKTCRCTGMRHQILGGLTIREAAALSELSPSMISRFLRNKRNLSYEALTRLSVVVFLNPEEILAEVGQ